MRKSMEELFIERIAGEHNAEVIMVCKHDSGYLTEALSLPCRYNPTCTHQGLHFRQGTTCTNECSRLRENGHPGFTCEEAEL
jgi:hypothetical protein